jgi:hypothetical protein
MAIGVAKTIHMANPMFVHQGILGEFIRKIRDL